MVNKYFKPELSHFLYGVLDYENAKQCALIAVDFAIDNIDWHEFEYPNELDLYLQQVKQEINNL
ncbi:hypothetical protein ACI3PL_25385 [Lacticaseibacillus paracasei]